MNRRLQRTLRRVVPIAFLAVVASACNTLSPDNNQNALRPKGPAAQDIFDLYKLVSYLAIAVGVLVCVALLYAMFRYRKRSDDDNPKQSHGNPIVEGSAVIGSFILLVIIGIPTVALIWKLEAAPAKSSRPLEVNVVGKQWWWQYAYPNPGDAVKVKDKDGKETDKLLPLVTSTELHIPVGRPIVLILDGRNAGTEQGQNPLAGTNPDVLHSFWIPELSGKRDMVPGRVNKWTIEASKPGKYLGQCAQYCGLSHANMRMRVIAHTQEDFDKWLAEQRKGPAQPYTEADGKTTLPTGAPALTTKYACGNCHVFNNSAVPNYAPNLTHLASRSTIAGGSIALFEQDQRGNPTGSYDLAALAHWIWDAPSQRYGVPMQGEGCRWPLPAPENLDPPPPCQGMPSFREKSYVPTAGGKADTAQFPLMTFSEACEIAEYLAAGRPAGMALNEGQCANPEAVK